MVSNNRNPFLNIIITILTSDRKQMAKWYGENGTGKMVWTKWYIDKMVEIKWYGQNGSNVLYGFKFN